MNLNVVLILVVWCRLANPSTGLAQTFIDASDLLGPSNGEAGIGASIVDVNSDGLVDLYRRNALYLQGPDGSFENVFDDLGYEPQSSGGFGAIFGDINNDGFLETFFLDLNPSLPFYLNRAGMLFHEHSNDSGIHNIELVQGSAWTDFNNDGLLDLFVGIDGGVSRLYRNIGLDFFQNEAASAGLDFRQAYGVAVADYDGDGYSDILLTQCLPPPNETTRENVLYRNNNGTFENVSPSHGIDDDLPSWGVVWLDYDNDGLLDFYVGNSAQRSPAVDGFNTLYRNTGNGSFEDVSDSAGVAHQRLS